MQNNLILCIETSGPVCSAALFDQDTLLSVKETSEPYSHSEKLTLMINDLFTESGFSPSQLKAVAVSSGPGSYTGLRIGTSVAKGLCYALEIPLIAIDTMTLLAHTVTKTMALADDTLIIPMTDARRMEVYCATLTTAMEIKVPVHAEIIHAESFASLQQPIVFCGDGMEKCKPVLTLGSQAVFSSVTHPSARYMGALAQQQFQQGNTADTAYFEPYYLKDFVATKPRS